MSSIRFSDEGKSHLQEFVMKKQAKAIAAHLFGCLAGITSNHHTLAMALDEFPKVLDEQMQEVFDHIGSNIAANGGLEESDCRCMKFSDEGKSYLQQYVMKKWAKAIAVHLLGCLAGITSDPHILAMAVVEFPKVLDKQMQKVLDDIDSNLQNWMFEEFEVDKSERPCERCSPVKTNSAD